MNSLSLVRLHRTQVYAIRMWGFDNRVVG